MRWTVLSSDGLVFFPAVLYFVLVYYTGGRNGSRSDMAWHIAMILLNPCLILIDHGHFQVEFVVFRCPVECLVLVIVSVLFYANSL